MLYTPKIRDAHAQG